MVHLTCDTCGDTMPDPMPAGTEWVLGFDLQIETPNALHNSVRFLSHWDDRRVLEAGAIHLCSLECRDNYEQKAA